METKLVQNFKDILILILVKKSKIYLTLLILIILHDNHHRILFKKINLNINYLLVVKIHALFMILL